MNDFIGEDALSTIYTWSVPFFAVIIIAEMIYSHVSKAKFYNTKDVAASAYLGLLNFGLDFLMKGFAMAIMFFFFNHKLFNWEMNIWYWTACFIATDFAYYILHYIDHHSRVFWAVHITHHNSDFFNLTTGFRSSVFEPLYRYLFFSPLAFLGFNPWHIMAVYALGQVYGLLVHTQSVKKMGFLEYILVTPSHHRVHHACNIKYLDRNMGMCLIIWDKLFGTFEKEDPNVPVKYGIYPKMPDNGPVTVVMYEWRKIWKDIKQPNISVIDRLKYILKSPGWKHDGTGKTVKQYQKEYFDKLEKKSKSS